MSKLKLNRDPRGSIGTAALAALCCAGAAAYALTVGSSLASWPDTASAAGAEVEAVSGASEEDGSEAPVGRLQVHVSDRDRAYIQNLTCTGASDLDPAACEEIAANIEQAAEDGAGNPFSAVDADAVCTDKTYGPQEAVISGTWEGAEVETTVSRENSCEEARWQRLSPLTDPMD
ncbi:hypothetical protein F4561_000976 [Lipingzhangella halophila]|uniref:Subtilisin inhibitor-like n=1 Tax=Lipingzhangella halophila TaxID=1783352 RepID=A0A7W7RDU2_9ACTN|nr:hypothetical protein [Lipingzhangella halophila]MBB4930156.1 hypothetical protein [Lipingzhangella halophila]